MLDSHQVITFFDILAVDGWNTNWAIGAGLRELDHVERDCDLEVGIVTADRQS